MENLHKRLELVANLAIIIVAIVFGIVLVKRYLIAQPANVASNRSSTESHLVERINLPGVDWSQRATLVLAISTSCHFCTESAPFYRDLAHAHEGVRLMAILPQPIEAGKHYLDTLGVQVDEVLQASLNEINVNGTPTLLLINREGTVVGKWVGRLPAEREVQVRYALSSTTN